MTVCFFGTMSTSIDGAIPQNSSAIEKKKKKVEKSNLHDCDLLVSQMRSGTYSAENAAKKARKAASIRFDAVVNVVVGGSRG